MKILVIDDRPHIRNSLARALERFGSVDLAENAGSARDFMRRGPYDWVIADLVLPDTKHQPVTAWMSTLRDEARGAGIVINSLNDSEDVVQAAQRMSFYRVSKGALTEIVDIVGGMTRASPMPVQFGLSLAQVEGMLEAQRREIANERDARITEIFKAMGLWDDMTDKPNFQWVRERKAAFDKTKTRMEKLGIGLASALVIAGAMLAFQLIWAGIAQKIGKP